MDKRNERILEEILKLPGNDRCADCRKAAPRWASVNIGIFLCVGCASIHRKMGTHRSRVKSVTLDDWTREQVSHMKSIGNTASNKVFNPNEALYPPPSSTGADERDSEMEKYIRRKYEQQAFRSGGRGDTGPAPTSLNRARERDGRIPASTSTSSLSAENRRNPELNHVVVKKPDVWRERELPALPLSASNTASSGSSNPGPRARPTPANSAPGSTSAVSVNEMFVRPAMSNGGTSGASNGMLIDVSGSTSSTLPLQINSAFPNQSLNVPQSAMATSYNGQGWMGSSPMGMNGTQPGMGTGSMGMGMNGNLLAHSAPSTSTQAAFNPFLQQQQQQQQSQPFQQSSPFPQQQFQQSSFPSAQSYPAFQQQQSQQFQSGFASQNPFGAVPAATSPYGQSPGMMGIQHSQGYFPAQGQGQPQMQSSGQWNGMGMGNNMPMGMVNGQYGYHT